MTILISVASENYLQGEEKLQFVWLANAFIKGFIQMSVLPSPIHGVVP